MDAFYASVEQRDDPRLRGLPVVVGGSPYRRGVVAACSYEAREFGIRSAMPSRQALSLCPHTVFVTPRFDAYKQVSKQIHAVFRHYTELVEPLSLDEAYLDLTACSLLQGSATRIAKQIKAEIYQQTGLIASAGVSYNKFLAKIASDMDKPDGFYRILPAEGEEFIARLPIGRFFGVGAVTEAKMISLGIATGADLRLWTQEELRSQFGARADYLYGIARGRDDRPVSASRTRKSIGSETTFEQDLLDRDAMLKVLNSLAEEVACSLEQHRLLASSITLKLRFNDFQLVTRSVSLPQSFDDVTQIQQVLPVLLDRALEENRSVRLLGVSVGNLTRVNESGPVQLTLFD